MLSDKAILKYNKFRKDTDKTIICHAPFVNLNFDQNGNMTVCCYNRKEILGKYPQDSILSAWQGEVAERLRERIKMNDLQGGCTLCSELIVAENFSGTKARFYDEYVTKSNLPDFIKNKFELKNTFLPRVFELELSNICNLECIMCSGFFSSSIRKNREKAKPFPFVYDANFVQQLCLFMPTLTDIKFLGGEPFLIDIYYDIWEKIIEINPKIRVHITTNGTVLNERGKRILERLNVGIILSLDTINQDTYSNIRLGASFNRVMENLLFFQRITKKKNTYLSVAACPMTANWKDIPDLLTFCNKQKIPLHYNVVWNPENLSIKSFPIKKLNEVIAFYEREIPTFFQRNTISIKNRNAYLDLIETFKFWQSEKDGTNHKTNDSAKFVHWIIETKYLDSHDIDEVIYLISSGFLYFDCKDAITDSVLLKLPIEKFKEYNSLKLFLLSLISKYGSLRFSIAYLSFLDILNNVMDDKKQDKLYAKKIESFKSAIKQIKNIDIYAYVLTEKSVWIELEKINDIDFREIQVSFFEQYGKK